MGKNQLTKATVEAAANYLEYKANAPKRKDGKWRTRQEVRLAGRISRKLKTQMNWVVAEAAKLSFFKEQKGVHRLELKDAEPEINKLVSDLPGNDYIVNEVVASARASYKKGAKKSHAEVNMAKYGASFDLVNQDAVQYLEKLRDLNLSDYRGSISKTTRDRIRKILVEAAQSGQSYGDTAKQIKAQGDAGVFSQARGELISTTEIGNAYSVGNLQMVKRFEERYAEVTVWKKWLIIQNELDDECDANAREGWVTTGHVFGSGNSQPLAHPRCVCDLGFETTKTGERPQG